MGAYLNPGNRKFQISLNSKIYVDKSLLIQELNELIDTSQRFVCVSRPRRFGKSITIEMLAAYYAQEIDSFNQFKSLKIAETKTFEKYRNKYPVIQVNMQEFLSETNNVDEMLELLQKSIMWELKKEYANCNFFDDTKLARSMQDIFSQTSQEFIILIDEWDCIFRIYKDNKYAQEKYLDFLRNWLKDRDYVALAYMTGILPIKKYGTHSALNMFTEYSMTNPKQFATYVGFTEDEVRKLCEQFSMNFYEAKEWYDGYIFSDSLEVYSPKSVVEAMLSKHYDTYWNQTETYEALKMYIDMNFDGLKDSIIRMLAGESCEIDIQSFNNDMVSFDNQDNVLTLLVHLGYLGYRRDTKEVYIPNKEVAMEYITAIRSTSWGTVIQAVKDSEKLLQSLWNLNESDVAKGVQKAHEENSILSYNDENALSCTINLAFYYAREYYFITRELPAGKGFADIVFLPKQNHLDKPAVIVELKYNKSALGAIEQIKMKQYTNVLKDYRGEILLVGINYDKKSKEHECIIEQIQK